MPTSVVFFFGAGASVKAQVPDTAKMVDGFLNSLAGNAEAQKTVREIVERLRAWAGHAGRRAADVELLMEMLDRLREPAEDPLLLFFRNAQYDLAEAHPKRPLIELLRDYIKSVCIVEAGRAVYLQPLLRFVDEARPVRVFTVNYDTVVEQFCDDFRLSFADGLEQEWQPKSFDKPGLDFQLYKIHGSVTWYVTDTGKYLKIPVLAERDEIQLFSREHARSLMSYPAQKGPLYEPLLRLLLELKSSLETAELAVVVGYSFRDPYVVQMFWEAARTNRNLQVILVGPHAYKTYSETLSTYPTGSPSSLSGRVVALPFLWEATLPNLRNIFVNGTREGHHLENLALQQERQGDTPDWRQVALVYARAGHWEKAAEAFGKASFAEALPLAIEVLHYLWLQCKAQGLPRTGEFSQALILELEPLTRGEVEAKGSGTDILLDVSFPFAKGRNVSIDEAVGMVSGMLRRERSWDRMIPEEARDLLRPAIASLEAFDKHLEEWKPGANLDNILKIASPEETTLAEEIRSGRYEHVGAQAGGDGVAAKTALVALVASVGKLEQLRLERLWQTFVGSHS